MDLIRPLVERVADLQASVQGMVNLRWGTVTQEDPLRVRLDADADPVPFKPATLVPTLLVGERVLCAEQNLRVTVLAVPGRALPASQPEVDAGLDDEKYVTPLTLAGVLPVLPVLDTLDLSPLFVAGSPSGTPTAYRQNGWVDFDGGVTNASNEIGYNTATTVLTLPSGWRPAKQEDFPSTLFTAAAVWDARVRVNTDGTVEVRIQRDGSSTNTGSRITFGAVRFRHA